MDSTLHGQDVLISKYPLRPPALERRIKHYSNLHQILLVGEGDFSFSAALANAFGSADNMVATSLDSREKIISSYESGQNNLHNLEKLGAMILHGVDVTTMNELEIIRERLFDRIVYNFPHAGFCGKEHDNKLIRKHRRLLKMFFKNGMTMLKQMGEIHVTHKEKDPYDKWQLVEQAEKCGLLLKESVDFSIADYPGYTNRRGAGPAIGETFNLGECRTYMFILRESMTTTIMLPESLKAATLELGSKRQKRKATRKKREQKIDEHSRQRADAYRQQHEASREKTYITKQLAEALRLKEAAVKHRDASILELEIERKTRKDAETAIANLVFSFNALRIVVDKTSKERDEFRRKKDEALREKANITKQLAEALRLKEDAAKQKDVTILELAFERKARKDAESARVNIEDSLHHYKVSVYDLELKKMKQLVSQRDDALYQKEQACRENEKIAKQLDEALRLKEEARNELANQKEEIIWTTVVCCGLGFGIKIISSLYNRKK